MASERWPRRWRAAGWWLVRLVEVALGMWAASVLVVGFTLAPWPAVVLAATIYQALLIPARRALAVLDRVDRSVVVRALDLGPEWQYVSIVGTWWVLRLAVHGAAAVVLFAGAGVVRFLRLITIAVVIRTRRSRLSWSVAELPLTALALAVGMAVLPGVELRPRCGSTG